MRMKMNRMRMMIMLGLLRSNQITKVIMRCLFISFASRLVDSGRITTLKTLILVMMTKMIRTKTIKNIALIDPITTRHLMIPLAPGMIIRNLLKNID